MTTLMTPSTLHQALSGLTTGEVYTDVVHREIYATAACLFRILPAAVVCPREVEEVAAIISFAGKEGIPVTARGAGSAVAGQSLGSGIIIDFTPRLNRMVSLDRERREVIVQPGIILGHLNRELKAHGLIFPPDPSSGDYATLGGMIANNSSGAHSLKYGDTRAWTLKLKVALADGTIAWLEPKALGENASQPPTGLCEKIYSELPGLLAAYAEAIARSRPRVKKNSSGYHVWDLVAEGKINPVPLVVGSEGTLAVTLEAVLKLAPLPAGRSAGLFSFADLDRACSAVAELRPLGPAALEIMDYLFIRVVREHRPDLRGFLPESAAAVLLVEFEAESQESADRLLEQSRAAVIAAKENSARMIAARDEAEIKKLFAVRQAASPILYRLPGKRLTRFIEDVVIPPERLSEGIRRIQEVLKKYDTEAPVLGHAGSGNLHLNPRLDLTDPADCERMVKIADEIYGLVLELGGSISGEHGDGLLRAPFLKRQFPELMPLFREIKARFDPHGVLNPGKILTEEDAMPLGLLRFKTSCGVSEFNRDQALMDMLLRCHGCGLCRGYCPVVAAIGEEGGLPRSKISLLRAMAQDDLASATDAERAELEKILALCTGCQRCVLGCPTGIEPVRVIRAYFRDQYQTHGAPAREKIFRRTGELLRLSSLAPGLAAAVAGNSTLRGLLEKGLQVRKSAAFPLPGRDVLASGALREASSLPAGSEKSHPLTGGLYLGKNAESWRESDQAVVYFPGCLGRFADREEETAAACEALRDLGFTVLIPDLPCCGEPNLQTADLEGASEKARTMLKRLSRLLAAGLPVVSACPTCALVFRHEYPNLIGEEARPLARAAKEFFEFVSEVLSARTERLTFAPARFPKALLHRPCHHAALGETDPVAKVLRLIPGLELSELGDACCGLAGMFGLRRENAEVADALAGKIVTAAKTAQTDLVISSCPVCRMQIRNLGLRAESAVKVVRDSLRCPGTGQPHQ